MPVSAKPARSRRRERKMRPIPRIRVLGHLRHRVPGVRDRDHVPGAVVEVDRLGSGERVAREKGPVAVQAHARSVAGRAREAGRAQSRRPSARVVRRERSGERRREDQRRVRELQHGERQCTRSPRPRRRMVIRLREEENRAREARASRWNSARGGSARSDRRSMRAPERCRARRGPFGS